MSVNGKANNQPIYNNYASDSNIIYYLGQFHVVNQGGAVSANKTVEFTYGNNDKIGVTAQKIPATTGNVVEVWYTTTTNPTEQKYNGTLISSGGFVAFTTQMAGLGKGEYFTKIKANVGSYEKDYVGYVSSRDQDPTSGYATTFGKLLTADEATYSNFASMKMYDTGSGDSTAKSGNYTVKVTNTKGRDPLGHGAGVRGEFLGAGADPEQDLRNSGRDHYLQRSAQLVRLSLFFQQYYNGSGNLYPSAGKDHGQKPQAIPRGWKNGG